VVYDADVFDRLPLTAGSAETRATAFMRAFCDLGADLVMAVRGGYGSVEILPYLDTARIQAARTAFIGYSDLTSVHSYFGACAKLTSVHGPMIEGRLGQGPDAYDADRFLRSLTDEPLGEIAPVGLEVVRPGEAAGPLVGGTLTQLLASLETPYAFRPPAGHVLFLEDVGERPYRIHRMLTQWRLSGRLSAAAAIVFGQFPGCEEPAAGITVQDVLRETMAHFPGPVISGFPSGHTTSPHISLPFGVRVRVSASASPALVFEEAAAEN
jgi:muramoyltetrapeptide carboxypeptidase